MLLGSDICCDHKYSAYSLRDLLDVLAGATVHHLLVNHMPYRFAKPQFLQGLIEARAGVGEPEVLAVIVHMAIICQRKDGFTAIAFTACHGGNRACRRDCGLRGVTDAMLFDSIYDIFPADFGTRPVMLELDQRLRRSPGHVVLVVDRACNGRERSALLRKFDAGLHAMITDELHDLRAELLPFLRSIAHADVIHQIGQSHDAEPDAAGFVRGFGELWNGPHLGVGFNYLIEEARGHDYTLSK